ncbi:putative ATPase [Kibdelosporangium banguiense]|uniref:ATPase n=1 Tax=Kibdelosporangium banguiense TaxID=1365924 RepID=A0ABS4TNY1_9PSEU|nr:tetratricopeptide repeat protein [Kibdelosporangium banguiense]MBP2325719.1 putative ATPase [Kibdelosporangium banguiense]
MAQAVDKPAPPSSRIVSNLPAERDSFVGRQHELIKLERLMRRHRLLTLTGSAGAGKTRLAIAAAGRVQRADTDRVLLVELGSVTDEQLLAQTVAAAAGLTEHSDEPILETIVATLRTMRVLVVLDNCEHLLDACAKLADTLLSRCPSMRILATSREALRITGEVTVRIDGLGVPDDGKDASVNALRRADSVRLFVERAKEMLPDYKLPAAEAHAVAAMCTRLDGIPLAIELAARWVPVLSAGEICARLDSRFDLLVMGGRTRPNRQRSLREAIDWSYELLAPGEQRALRRLAVFVGGFDLEAATAVCGLDTDTTLDMISRLQAKSLLTGARFRLLESIRLYAMQRLTDAEETDSAYEALASWLAGMAEAFVTTPMSVPREIRRLAATQASTLRVVCEWTGTRYDERHVLLSTALAVAHANLGFLADARKVLREALDQPQGEPRHRCAALDRAGWFAGFQGDFTEGIEHAHQSLAIARDLADPGLITNCLTTLACVQQMAGELDLALRHRTECVETVRDLDQPFATATCLAHLAWSLSLDGDQEQAWVLAQESLAICRRLESVNKAAEALNVLGGIALRKGDLDVAENVFREVLHTNSKYPHNLPNAIEGLALVAAGRGEQERALRLYEEALPMRRATGVIGDPYWQRQVTDGLGLADQVP